MFYNHRIKEGWDICLLFFSFLLLHIHIATWKKKVNNFHTYLGDGKNTGMGINWYGMGNYGSVFFCVFFFLLHFTQKPFFFWRKSVMKETEWFLSQRMF